MNAKYLLGAIIVIIVAGAALLLGGQPTGYIAAGTQQEKITLGAIVPLTGPIANVGQNVRAAIELAVEEVNESGGINGRKLQVVFEDGQCDAKAAATAAHKLVELDGVSAIVGGTCSSETLAAAPIAEASRTVLLSNCSSNPAITNAGDYVFRAYPSDSFQGKVAAEFALQKLEAKKVAVISCLSDWCVGIKNVFNGEFVRLGGTIAVEQEFEQGSKDLRTQLLKVKQANPDLIYFLAYTEEAVVGMKQARELGIEAKVLGADAWEDSALWDNAKESGEGAMYTTVSCPLTDEFNEAMEEKVGEVTQCSPQAYDAVHLIANALRRCGENSTCIKGELYKVKGHSGVSGEIGFDSNGDLTTASYVIRVARNGKVVDYS